MKEFLAIMCLLCILFGLPGYSLVFLVALLAVWFWERK